MSSTAIVKTDEPRSLQRDMGARYGLEADKFMLAIRAAALPPNATNEQAMAFLVVAHQYELNPFTKEIYAFVKDGKVVPIVSVDGWASLINRRRELDGIEFADNFNEDRTDLISITCRIYRKDRSKPVEVTEYMDECKKSTEPWQKWPARMLRHKAFIQAARYAFALSGIYDEDEGERIINVTPTEKQTLEAPALELADPLIQEIAKLFDESGANNAQRHMLLGQYQGRLAELKTRLESDLAKSRTPKPETTATTEHVGASSPTVAAGSRRKGRKASVPETTSHAAPENPPVAVSAKGFDF